ncbi:MAG: Ldh family oxidoreductase [Rhodospirillales bacterium]
MRSLSENQALALTESLLNAAGLKPDPAGVVAAHLVDASLRGVDSHGLERVPQYLRAIADGSIQADAVPEVSWVREAILQVTGHEGLGIPAMQLAAERLAPLAHERGIAAAAVIDVAHTGRIGRYVESLALAGCFAFAFGGGSYQQGGSVAPYGGKQGVLSTNPYALALPGGALGPVVVDFATATLAQGKLSLARERGSALPEDCLLDNEGRPTTSAEDFFNGGALLPAAGPKGYGLALIAELIGCALIGPPKEFNWLIVALDLARFRTPSAFAAAAQDCLEAVKAVQPQEGFAEVQIPGEPERVLIAERRCNGIPIDAVLEAALEREAATLGLDLADLLAGR